MKRAAFGVRKRTPGIAQAPVVQGQVLPAAPPRGPKRRRVRLRTVQDVSRELRRIYVAARSGEIDLADATKLAFVLAQVREALAIEAENQPQRMLTAQERAIAVAQALVMHFKGRPLPPDLASPAEQPAVAPQPAVAALLEGGEAVL